MRRTGMVWFGLFLTTWAFTGQSSAASLPDLPAEHRNAEIQAEIPADILSSIPAATSNMFSWNLEDGSYRFGYQGPDHWRVESRSATGNVIGRYWYRTPGGQIVDVSYDAGPQGYQARGDAIPGGAAPPINQQKPEGVVLKQGGRESSKIEEENVAVPYGALRFSGQLATRPLGEGVTTFADDNNLAIVTDVSFRQAPVRQAAVFPIVVQPGFEKGIAGPVHINNKPVFPAAIPV